MVRPLGDSGQLGTVDTSVQIAADGRCEDIADLLHWHLDSFGP
ncbi:hypothetical protein [Streptomyces laurentii]